MADQRLEVQDVEMQEADVEVSDALPAETDTKDDASDSSAAMNPFNDPRIVHGRIAADDTAFAPIDYPIPYASDLFFDPDIPGAHRREQQFRLFEMLEHYHARYDFSDLSLTLVAQQLANSTPGAKRFPVHALIAVSMNDHVAKMRGRGKFRHSLGTQYDQSVIVYADAAWTEEQARGYLGMNPLQRVRCSAAWSMTLWTEYVEHWSATMYRADLCSGHLRVTYFLCAQPSKPSTSANVPDHFTIMYQMVDKNTDARVLIFIESCGKTLLVPLKEILQSEPAEQGFDLSRGPWMSRGDLLNMSDAGTKYPNLHYRFSWYWHSASLRCQKWAKKWKLEESYESTLQEPHQEVVASDQSALENDPDQELDASSKITLEMHLHRQLVANIERDFDLPDPINLNWSAMYNRLMFVGRNEPIQ